MCILIKCTGDSDVTLSVRTPALLNTLVLGPTFFFKANVAFLRLQGILAAGIAVFLIGNSFQLQGPALLRVLLSTCTQSMANYWWM